MAVNFINWDKRLKRAHFKREFLFSPLSLALMSCGGGSESSDDLSTYSGYAIKGPLENAIVFADLNNNGKLDTDEPNTVSSADGSFSFTSSTSDFEIVVSTSKETIDTSSGENFDGLILKAPSVSTVVSPLTTMVIESDLSKEKLADILGLGEIDILSFNPFSDGVDAAEALKVEKAAHQTQLTLSAIAASGKEAGPSDENARELAIEAITDKLEKSSSDGSKIDLSNEDTLKDLVSTAETKIEGKGGRKADFAKSSSLLIDQVKDKNTEISKLNSLNSTEALSVFANTATISDTLVTEIKTQTISSSTIDDTTTVDSTNDNSTQPTFDPCEATTSTATTTTVPTPVSLAMCESTTTFDPCEATTSTATTTTVTTPVSLGMCESTTTSTTTTTATTTTPSSTTDSSTTSTSAATTTTASTSDTTTTTTTTTPTVTSALLVTRDPKKIDSVWGTQNDDYIYVGAEDNIVHTSAGYDIIVLGGGSDILIIENTTGHSVIRDFDVGEDQLVLAIGVFTETTEIIDDNLHLYTNLGGHVEFDSIGDISALII